MKEAGNPTTLRRIVLFLRSVFFAAAIPGTVVGLVPYLFVSGHLPSPPTWGAVEYAGLFVLCLGVSIMGWCMRDFAVIGHGTAAPIDPPTTLVQGLYRYVRNPMYVGALMTLLGETTFARSAPLLYYTGAWFIWVNLFVFFYEEPALRRQFGVAYEEYCRSAGRWLPSSRP
jgi:protein-S-isoprenylcysteine O-methyltransferase Ste14